MLFDTDILIWLQRGLGKAAALVENSEVRNISIVTYMELLQTARTKREHDIIRGFLRDFDFRILALSENIGHRAAVYLEEYGVGSGLMLVDALIAATATEHDLVFVTGNAKHFKPIKGLRLSAFKAS